MPLRYLECEWYRRKAWFGMNSGVGYPENGVAYVQIWLYNAIFLDGLPQVCSRYVCTFGEMRPRSVMLD